jgi:hypothetical protein
LSLTHDSQGEGEGGSRKSPRLKEKNKAGKTITKVAQELVAKKCGIISDKEPLDGMTLQQYMDLYKQPLTEQSMEAILKLAEVALKKEEKKKVKKLKKTKEEDKAKGIKGDLKKMKEKKKRAQKQAPVGASA